MSRNYVGYIRSVTWLMSRHVDVSRLESKGRGAVKVATSPESASVREDAVGALVPLAVREATFSVVTPKNTNKLAQLVQRGQQDPRVNSQRCRAHFNHAPCGA